MVGSVLWDDIMKPVGDGKDVAPFEPKIVSIAFAVFGTASYLSAGCGVDGNNECDAEEGWGT